MRRLLLPITVVANAVIANIVIANSKDLCFSSQVGFITPAAFCRQAAAVLVAPRLR
jgi:hypothetical protein